MAAIGKIAFLGAGRMGRGMMTSLRRAGHVVTVYNRSDGPCAMLAGLGIDRAATPAAAADGAAFVIAMVAGDEASRDVWTGPGGALEGRPAPGAIAIESSTVSMRWTRSLAAAASEHGIRFMDCPVAGRPDAALAGALTVFAGASPDALDRARTVLAAISREILHMGPVGAGIAFKLIYNALGATQIAGLAEAMAACRQAGLDPERAALAFCQGATGSAHVRLHAPMMAKGEYPPVPPFTPSGRIKDLGYAITLMREIGLQPGLADAARALFERVDMASRDSISDTQLLDFIRPHQPGGSGR